MVWERHIGDAAAMAATAQKTHLRALSQGGVLSCVPIHRGARLHNLYYSFFEETHVIISVLPTMLLLLLFLLQSCFVCLSGTTPLSTKPIWGPTFFQSAQPPSLILNVNKITPILAFFWLFGNSFVRSDPCPTKGTLVESLVHGGETRLMFHVDTVYHLVVL